MLGVELLPSDADPRGQDQPQALVGKAANDRRAGCSSLSSYFAEYLPVPPTLEAH
jgi:hypothetical protein